MKRARLFNLRLFAVIFASLVLGIAFSVNTVVGIVFFFIYAGLVFWMFWKTPKRLYILVILLTYLMGFFYASGLNWADEGRNAYPDEGYIIGDITAESEHDVDGNVTGVIVLDNVVYNDVNIGGRVRLVLPRASLGALDVGDEVGVRGSLIKETIDTSALGMVRPYLKGIRYTIADGILDKSTEGNIPWRDRVVMHVEHVLFDELDVDTAGFLSGMMFGDTGLITDGVRSASKRLGIAHLFAVSGLHVGMIVGFAMLILTHTRLNKKWYLLILPVLYFYAYMCNFSVSVIRACIMVTLLLVSKACYMRYDMLTSLGVAGTIILLINPYYLFDISFVMSFLAVLSIALFSDRFFKLFTRHSTRFKTMKMVLASNISVNIGLLPIMLHLFGGISLLTVPVNFVLIPIITAIFPMFFLLTILAIVTHLYMVLPVLAFPFVLIVALSRLIASLNFLAINFSVSWYFVCTYIIVMILVSKYVFLHDRIKLVPKIALVSVLALALIMPSINTAIFGDSASVVVAGKDYAMTYVDDYGNRIMVVMGKPNGYAFSRASDMMNRINVGRVDILVLPDIDQSDMAEIDAYNEGLRAESILTREDIVFKTAETIGAHEGIVLEGDGNVEIDAHHVSIVLADPKNKYINNGNYDMVVAHNNNMIDNNFTSNYYTNFSKSSHGETCLDFTFCTKNGRITLYKERS